MTPLILVSLWDVQQDELQVFAERVRSVMWSIRREPGCLFFDFYRVVSRNALVGEVVSSIALHEVWKNHEARLIHLQGPSAAQLLELRAKLISTPVRMFEAEEIV